MDVEDDRYFGLCKCCLQDGCFKSLWVNYQEDGVVQNFGEMLKECFGLSWQRPDNKHLDQICDGCIQQTKDTYMFRLKVLMSQAELTGGTQVCIKSEMTKVVDTCSADLDEKDNMEISVKREVKAEAGDQYDPEYLEEPDDANDPDYQDDSDANCANEQEYITYANDHNYIEDCGDQNLEQFEDVEYLEIEYDKELETITGEIQTQSGLKVAEQQTEPPKRKWPKKKKKGERRSYKNYTLEDLKNSVEAAKSGLMSPAAAGQHYNVPRKTIAARLLAEKRGLLPKPKTSVRSRYHLLIEEVETLLTYTNATPFKTKTGHYHCAYCSTMGPVFEDADQLRTHTRTQHAGERTKSVELFLKPLWLNEVLKVDIENLHCSVCCTVLVSWNDMFKHLKEQHDLDFDEAYTRVIPFTLNRELRCALCKDSFPNFHHLDGHMNAHYNNYMCSECGDTFLSESRLKKHLKIHNTGRFPCDECGKTYSLDKYRKKHIELVHKQEQNIKCLYCEQKFLGTYPRHLHVMQCHREKVSFITCELCGKTFDWRPYYLVHVRRKHENEKKYKCHFCEALFFMKSELTRHVATHTGEKFTCEMCGKQYSSKTALTTHMIHIHRQNVVRPRLKPAELA